MKEIKKRWSNSSGDIEVRQTDTCGIVEMMYYWDKNESGCVIGYWGERKIDGFNTADFISVNDRLSTTKFDDGNILLEAIRFGDKLASLLTAN